MRVVVGVDDKDRGKHLGDTLQALGFPDLKLDVVHVLESWGSTPIQPLQANADLISRYLQMQQDNARELLESVRQDLDRRAFAVTGTYLLKGFTSNRLLEHADENQADLIALASSGKGPLEGIIIGSVTRKAVIGAHRSVLVAKRALDPSRPLTVVLATDHSPYANKCVDTFARWAPKGIGRLVVTTVYPEQLVKEMASAIKDFKADVAGWVRRDLEQSNEEVRRRLSGLGATSVSRVETGFVNDVLERVVTEEGADLLVLGAQGHGFIERLTLGSVSLEQAIRRPHSVLIVRA